MQQRCCAHASGAQVAERYDVELIGYRDAAVSFEGTTALTQGGQAAIIGLGLTCVLVAHAATVTPGLTAAADMVSTRACCSRSGTP